MPNTSRRAAPWPVASDAPALLDVWAVYVRDYDVIGEEIRRDLAQHPVFGPILAALPPDKVQAQFDESRRQLALAIAGDWASYEAVRRVQGAGYARTRVAFRDWRYASRLLVRFLVPRLVVAYGDEPARLTAALLALDALVDCGMLVMAEAYLEASDELIRQGEHRLSVMLDSIGDGVIATDADARVTRMNPVASRLCGWDTASAIGRPLAEVFQIRSELTGRPAVSPVERVVREGVVVGLANHTELVSPSGAVTPIADSAAPIRDDDGVLTGVIMVFRDQTEERRAEAERLRSAVLESEKRSALEANRLKSEFLANMSHELRTPLNAIIGFSQLLFDGEVGPVTAEQSAFLEHVLRGGRHLLGLTNDVLDLAKIESGKLVIEPEEVNLPVLCREVVDAFEAEQRSRGLTIRLEVDPALGPVVLDARRVRQVLFNYVSNAVKFSSPNGQIQVVARAATPDTLRIEVHDEGVGIEPEDIPRLFVEFQQLYAGAARRHAGTGLGLALTRRLVEAMGGEVGVRSQPRVGSTFWAVLPRHASSKDTSPAREA